MNSFVAQNQEHKPKKAHFQPGYGSVLIRCELKKAVEAWRKKRGLNDTHYERCLTSALIQIGLESGNEERLIELLAEAVAKDFKLSSPSMTGNSPNRAITHDLLANG